MCPHRYVIAVEVLVDLVLELTRRRAPVEGEGIDGLMNGVGFPGPLHDDFSALNIVAHVRVARGVRQQHFTCEVSIPDFRADPVDDRHDV